MTDNGIMLRGAKYVIPANVFESRPQVTITKLRLLFGKHTLDTETDMPRLILPDGTTNFTHLTLHLGCDDSQVGETVSVAFCLFREGTERPVMTYCDFVDFDVMDSLSASQVDGELTAGRYFLVGGNVKGDAATDSLCAMPDRLCYTFEIWPSGASMEHPQLCDAEVCRKAGDVRVGRYTSGALRLYCSLGTRMVGDSVLRAVCYSEDWQLMAEGESVHPRSSVVRERVGVTLRSGRVWMDGRYRVVMSHNDEPFAVAEFVYDGARSMPCTVTMIGKSDVEYMLAKHVAPHRMLHWHDVCRLNGMREVKPELVRSYCRVDFDSLCQQHGLSLGATRHYAVITAPVASLCRRLSEVLPSYLHFAFQSVEFVSCRGKSAEELHETFDELHSATVVITDLGALTVGRDKLSAVEAAIEDMEHSRDFIFVGTPREMERLLAQSHVIVEVLGCAPRFDLAYPSVSEMVNELYGHLRRELFMLTPEAEDAMARQVMAHGETIREWVTTDYVHYVRSEVIKRLKCRVQGYIDSGREVKPEDLFALHPSDLDMSSFLAASDAGSAKVPVTTDALFEQSMAELNAMVGLTSLKEQLARDFTLMRFHEQRRQLGLPTQSGATHHMLFTGNPGTGKTTVARLIGKIYHTMGYLSRGEVIALDRSQLVGTHIGYTEDKMVKLLKRAKGNVLFIDEAYALCDSTDDRKDFGYHVIEALLPVMAEPHPDMIVIFAGYASEMTRLMEANPGLKGRFSHHLHFEDYNADELLQISANLLAKNQYTLTPEAQAQLRNVVERAVKHKDRHFSNARWAVQLVESGLLPAMARRVVPLLASSPERELLTTIEEADVEEAARLYAPRYSELHLRPRIGFVA